MFLPQMLMLKKSIQLSDSTSSKNHENLISEKLALSINASHLPLLSPTLLGMDNIWIQVATVHPTGLISSEDII